jgi:hypothetical protein
MHKTNVFVVVISIPDFLSGRARVRMEATNIDLNCTSLTSKVNRCSSNQTKPSMKAVISVGPARTMETAN